MNHRKILERAWAILRQYRALWVFGFLFALAGGQSGLRLFNGSGSGSGGGNNNPSTGSGQFPNFHWPSIDWGAVVGVIVLVVLVLLLLGLVALVVRYLAETALMAGVDEIETTGAGLTVRRGFRLGWSRQALKLFLTDLGIYLPLFLVSVVLVGVAALPLLFWFTHVVPLGVLASIITGALELLVILSLAVVSLALSLLMPYIRRRVVLHNQGVLAAVRQSVQLARATLVDTGLLWLLLTALRIVWSLVMIPLVIVVVLVALVVGGIPAGLIYLVSQSWIVPAIVGGALFLLVLVPITAFVEGLFEAYVSTVWTLAYREVVGKLATPPVVPAPVEPVAPIAPTAPLATA